MNLIPDRLRRRERVEPWASAATREQIAELTALWLEGTLRCHPGWASDSPAAETAAIAPTLIAVNRLAGFITDQSQPGTDPRRGIDGAVWRQRAAVHGLLPMHPAEWLAQDAIDAGFIAVTNTVGLYTGLGTTVTERDGQPQTVFGNGGNDWADFRFDWRWCPRATADSLARMTQIALIDPQWGPTRRLWDFLDAWAADPWSGHLEDHLIAPPEPAATTDPTTT